MSELIDFPMVNQLEGTSNAAFDCVPASICAGMGYITHKTYDPDVLKSWAYGADYSGGGTAASAFVAYCAQEGVDLFAVQNSDYAGAVTRAHREIQNNHPVIFTQQDDYSNDPSFTHVCVWYSESPNILTCMDPFGGFPLTYTDAQWIERLRNTELWLLERSMNIPRGWHDDGTTLYPPDKSFPVIKGFRNRILTSNFWDSGNVPREAEHAVPQIELHTNSGPGTMQIFRDTVLLWTASRGVVQSAEGDELKKCYELLSVMK